MRLSSVIFGLLFATAAFAQKIPKVNIENYCRSKSMIGSGGSDEIYATCVDGETVALGELRGKLERLQRGVSEPVSQDSWQRGRVF
jgi:hypothetical protein